MIYGWFTFMSNMLPQEKCQINKLTAHMFILRHG